MLEILEFTFSSFWVWFGMTYCFWVSLRFMFIIYNRSMRCLMVRKHGWPPPHLDADGDFLPVKKTQEEPEEWP